MSNLREVRDRIESVENTQQITRAMKMVAAARLRKAQDRLMAARPYAFKLNEIIERLTLNTGYSGPLTEERKDPQRVLYIIIGSDKGLCGAFNNNLFRVVQEHMQQHNKPFLDQGTLVTKCIGKKPHEFFNTRNYAVDGNHVGFFDNLQFDKAANLMTDVTRRFKDGEFDRVYLAFNEFKSVITQNRIIEQLLPIRTDATFTMLPEKEMSAEGDDTAGARFKNYLFEPEPENIISRLLPLQLNIQLWRALLESFGSEQGARMAAMDNATENAKEMMRELRIQYNRARQAAITTELSEIVSGAEALSES